MDSVVLNLIQCGSCETCKTPIVFPSFAHPNDAPKPIKLCDCKRPGKRKAFEKAMRACYARADVEDEDASEVVLLLGTILGRAQAAVLNGDKAKLRKHLVQLVALGWKLGDEL